MTPRLLRIGSRLGKTLLHVVTGKSVWGYCPICERRAVFCIEGEWLRAHFRCARCRSNPRWRALISVLESFFPEWRDMRIHESSPGGGASDKIARECKQCIQSHWFADVPAGQMQGRYRSENLEKQTFPDASFDMVISQDVFEHVLDPASGFAEIARTLKPGGAHVFTVPWHYWKPTVIRARQNPDGTIRHLLEPAYHGNPIDPDGSLVTTDWGFDLCDFIYLHSKMTTTAVRINDRRQGIDAKFIEVFISRKPAPGDSGGETPGPAHSPGHSSVTK